MRDLSHSSLSKNIDTHNCAGCGQKISAKNYNNKWEIVDVVDWEDNPQALDNHVRYEIQFACFKCEHDSVFYLS